MTKPASPSTEAPAMELVCDSCGKKWGSPTVNLLTCGVRLTGEEWCKGTIRYQPVAPQPIERCSCAESMRLRAALGGLLADCMSDECRLTYKAIAGIARRALALEPEGD